MIVWAPDRCVLSLSGDRGRSADEQTAAAGRVAGRCVSRSRPGLRAGNRHTGNRRLAVGSVRIATQVRVEQIFDIGRGRCGEVHLHQMRAGRDRHTEPHALQDLLVPLVSTHTLGSAHRAGPDLDVVEADVELMRLVGDTLKSTGDATLSRPHFEEVVTIGREVVAKRGATARAERQLVADAGALIAIGRHEDRLWRGRSPRPSKRHLTDLRGRSQIPLRQRRRQRQSIGVVVEPIRRVVCGQQRRIDVEGEQVANGVAILRAIQAVQRGPTGVGVLQRRAVELGLEPRHDLGRHCRVGPRQSGGRHRAGPKLAHDLFPHVRVLAHVRHIQRVERQAAHLGALVVAGRAVLPQHGAKHRVASGRMHRRFAEVADKVSYRPQRGRLDEGPSKGPSVSRVSASLALSLPFPAAGCTRG